VTTLELITRKPDAPGRRPALLFVHGAFVAAWCWDEYFLPWFAAAGYDAHAVSLRGHGGSASHGPIDAASLDDYVADTIAAVERIGARPVLIGHSMGAIVVQRAARRCGAQGLVLMAPVPPHGLSGTLFSLATRDPPLFFALSALHRGNGDRSGALARARDYLFSQTVTEADVRRFLPRMQPESQRALADLAWPQHYWISPSRGLPALVIGAERDAFFPGAMIEEAAQFHGVAARMFRGMAHAMMLEPQWLAVAAEISGWLEAQRWDGV
jgi:pimeloyl-ACP methyl ester carboxylesterase